MHLQTRLRRPALFAAVTAVALGSPIAVLSAPTATGAPVTAAAARVVPGRYIVMTAGTPLAGYRGDVAGFAKTRPAAGKKLNARTPAAKRYRSYLVGKHKAVLADAAVPAGARLHDYSVAFNGFAAELTAAQAARLERTPGVVKVWKDEVRTADTVSTPRFLGLDGAGGVWQRQFGGDANAGQGMIVADLDSGIWPDNPSFAALPTPRPDQAEVDAKWKGVCDTGTEEPIACNNKLIGARYYGAEFGNDISLDFNSPRDTNGHGSHTASTAAGNHDVPVTINGLGFGSASGMAPAARIAAYKVLWQNDAGEASGTTDGIVAAIDQAVADGADVINYSISGASQFVVTPDEISFMFAADAGVFVSASAGNDGDTVGAGSVAHNAPWEMTVAASTHDRGAAKTVTLGNGASYQGLGYGPAVPSTPIIDSSTAGLGTALADEAKLCFSDDWAGHPVLDPAEVTGKIVTCTRGVNDRVDKSKAVKEAGGVGMVLADANAAQSPTADFHAVPSIHVNSVDGEAVKAYIAGTASATASISATDTSPVEAPSMAGFSSFGPAVAGGGDLLKPDITAPGVGVIAAVAPPNHRGLDFDSLDGTSMAAPHIAGIAALIMQRHPTWSPMWVKSALMTGATTLDNRGAPIKRGTANATPLDYGSGHVRPAQSFDPGLVYDSTLTDWVRYGCGIGQMQLVFAASVCEDFGSIDASDLNYPSIAVSGLAGTQTVSRTFTNTSTDQASQYKPTIVSPPGTTVKVDDSKITVPPRRSGSYKLTITRTSAPLDAWTFGSITWTDQRGHSVRSPIAVRPVALAAPTEQTVTGTEGSASLTVTPGYSGTLNAKPAGLVAAHVDTVDTPKPTNATVTVNVPAGTTVSRFATFDADYPAGTDIDLVVRRDGAVVGSSGGGTAEESVTLNNPPAGTYTVTVDYFAGATDSIAARVNSFVLGGSAAGNFTATPASQTVTVATPATVTAAWSGLSAGTRYLGSVSYDDGSRAVGRTLVSVLP